SSSTRKTPGTPTARSSPRRIRPRSSGCGAGTRHAEGGHMSLRRLVVAASIVAACCLAGSAQSPFTFRVVATGLGSPWEVTRGPDGQLWVSERTARRVVRIDPATGAITPAVMIAESYDPGMAWHEGL